jgi:ERCC4-related helicase
MTEESKSPDQRIDHFDIENDSEDEPEDELVGDSGRDEEEDDKDTITVFDEEKFFSSPSFPPEELKEASKRICAAFQAPLRRLKEGGYHEYIRYMKEKEQKQSNNINDQRERMQQIIQDAIIQGDPRGYQRALFEAAKCKNTIINLGTGYGKTLIALLCIRHFSPSFAEGKQTLFLVPSVALAIQQSTTLRANLPNYSIQTACYASSNSEGARQALAKSNVIVATHGAVRILSTEFCPNVFNQLSNSLFLFLLAKLFSDT